MLDLHRAVAFFIKLIGRPENAKAAYLCAIAALLAKLTVKGDLILPGVTSPAAFGFLDRQILRQSGFDGRRIVIFSGGASKGTEDVLNEIREIKEGGGFGSIVGRNAFQRSHDDAVKLLRDIMAIYKG